MMLLSADIQIVQNHRDEALDVPISRSTISCVPSPFYSLFLMELAASMAKVMHPAFENKQSPFVAQACPDWWLERLKKVRWYGF